MLLSEIDGQVCIDYDKKYCVDVEPGPFLVIRVLFVLDNARAQFDHKNLLARFHEVLEFKHYHPKRGKYWTNKPGAVLFFAVPKDKIELVYEKTYSYPLVRIGGKDIRLSTSGCSTSEGGWVDMIRVQVGTLVDMPMSSLKAIADNAMSIGEAKAYGITLKPHKWSFEKTEEDAEARRKGENECIKKMMAQKIVSPKIDMGWRVVLSGDYKIHGSHGPFIVHCARSKKKRRFTVGSTQCYTTVYYKHIDWVQTAKLNSVELPSLVDVNRVPEVNS